MKELEGVKKLADGQLHVSRKDAGLYGFTTSIPEVLSLVPNEDNSPVIRLKVDYADGSTALSSIFDLPQRPRRGVTIHSDLDSLLMYLCDAFDRNPHNKTEQVIGDIASQRTGVSYDVYLKTSSLHANIQAVATLVSSILEADFKNGSQVFGRDFFDMLIHDEATKRDELVKKLIDDTIQSKRRRFIAIRDTNPDKITAEVNTMHPPVTEENIFGVLTDDAGRDSKALNHLLDSMIFARLGILNKPREIDGAVEYVDPVTKATVLVTPSEDELFSVEFAYILPPEISSIHFQDIEGNMTLTRDQNNGGDESVVLTTERAQMDYSTLREFLFDSRTHHNSPRTAPIRYSPRSGVADIRGLKFGSLRGCIPECASNKEPITVTIARFQGSLLIDDTPVSVKVSHSNMEFLNAQYTHPGTTMVTDSTVGTLSCLEGNLVLRNVNIGSLDITRVSITGEEVVAATISQTDSTGPIALKEGSITNHEVIDFSD